MIADKYKLIRLLGEGGAGKTYEAEKIATRQRVAIKVITLRQVKDWKVIELFAREANVLANLEHPAIPRYIDYFYQDTPSDRYFYLVRELVSGDSLFDLVRRGWKPHEDEVKEIARQILDILQYLHQQKPPVIHRDIKPQNLIKSESGKIVLVDFGSVTEANRCTLISNSTFVGTLGYMPPEQLRGIRDKLRLCIVCQSVLSQKSRIQKSRIQKVLNLISSFELQRMKLDFRDWVNISDRFANWLAKIIEPIAEDRFQSVGEALSIAIILKSANVWEFGEYLLEDRLLQSKGLKGNQMIMKCGAII